MERDEALRLLGAGPDGVREWNERRAGGEPIPTLRGAALTGAGLVGADLSEADLSGA
jgi:hypothetical protein